MADMGMENMAKSLSTAFANPEVGITCNVRNRWNDKPSYIRKNTKRKNAIQKDWNERLFCKNMTAPEALEMPENISESE